MALFPALSGRALSCHQVVALSAEMSRETSQLAGVLAQVLCVIRCQSAVSTQWMEQLWRQCAFILRRVIGCSRVFKSVEAAWRVHAGHTHMNIGTHTGVRTHTQQGTYTHKGIHARHGTH